MSTYLTEEEQVERIKHVLKKYNTHITVFISAVLLSFGIFQYYNWHKNKQDSMLSTAYENMMVQVSNNNDEQIEVYAKKIIEISERSVYTDAALMTLANLNINNNNLQAAKDYLKRVKNFTPLKEVAKIRMARIQNEENLFDDALETLNSVKAREFLPLVNETKGDIYARMKRFDEALKFYEIAANDEFMQSTGNTLLGMKINEIKRHVQKSNS
jgi:predicted negative regulator of RcsB-dependent stress response